MSIGWRQLFPEIDPSLDLYFGFRKCGQMERAAAVLHSLF
jgi:hypothetical protein